MNSLKSKKKKLALCFIVSVEMFYYGWGIQARKLICIKQLRFYNFSRPREFKNV